jgi:hypothetical protein
MSAVAKLGASDGARCWSSLYIAAIDPCWARITPDIAVREMPTIIADTHVALVLDRMVELQLGTTGWTILLSLSSGRER